MDQKPPELSYEDSLKQVMQTLPPVVRAYIVQGKYTRVAKGLMSKYGLRIDQGGILERELMLLLMGIETPAEFMQALAEELKLSPQVVASIAQDVNTQIFMPLRAEEMKSGALVPGAVAQRAPEVRKPEGRPGKYFHLENKIPTAASSTGSTPPVVRPAPPTLTIARPVMPMPEHIAPLPPKMVLPRSVALPAHSQMDASKLLEDHEEPHIELNKIPAQPPVPRAPSAPIAPAVPSAPRFAPPPNLPGAMPPIAPTPPLTPRPVASTPVKLYSADPYREPIDEPPV